MRIHTSYLRTVYDTENFQKVSCAAVEMAERLRDRYDAITFTGHSGAALAFIIGHWLEVPLICVRKRDENSHYPKWQNHVIEGAVPSQCRYLIVDDFVETGDTLRRIINEMNRFAQTQNQSFWEGQDRVKVSCAGVLLYAAMDFAREDREDQYFLNEQRSKEAKFDLPFFYSRPAGLPVG